MKTNLTFLIFLLFSQTLFSQAVYNEYFSFNETVDCPFNDSIPITIPSYWKIYQTQDGKWDGLLDSTKCIGLIDDSGQAKIALTDIDITQPVFVKSEIENLDGTRLNSDRIYRASMQISLDEGVALDLEEDCENNLCSGIFVGLEIPDSLNQGRVLREYRGSLEEAYSNNFRVDMCYATEQFDTTYLKEFIFKITLSDTSDINGSLGLKVGSNYENMIDPYSYHINDINISDWSFQDTSYNIYLMDLAYSYYNYLLMYTDTTYPSPLNPSYIDANLIQNQPTVQTINLSIDQGQTLVFQPYANIRGGLVEGSDSLRHEFNIINDGGSMCMEEFLEVFFYGNNTYIHINGDLNFHGKTSCFMFKNGGELKVAKDAYLQYGDGGEGILALGRNAKVNLEMGSTMVIDNQVMMIDIVDGFEEQIKVDLQPGSALIFGPNAKVNQGSGELSNQMINVYMNGGFLDDQHLSAEEKSLINRIYPESNNSFELAERMLVYPNPVKDALTYRYESSVEQLIDVEVINTNGQVIYKAKHNLIEGINDHALDFRTPTQGVYVLRLNTRDGMVSTKFVK